MIGDAGNIDRSAFGRELDVCVIGAGPAGITLARRVAAAGAEVALMEAGGAEVTLASQDVYAGENVGLDYFDLDIARLRCFGGSSNHWYGWCRALDRIDFAPKSYNPLSGWPIGQSDLDPYRAEADAVLDIPPAADAAEPPFRQAEPRFRRFQVRLSPPTRFGAKYRAEIEASPRIRLVLNANLVDLRLAPDLAAVAGAVFRSYAPGDPGFAVRARAYCLCTGGIENPRLLLNFRSQVPEGIGNRHGLVGRYFCEHPHFVVADVLLRAPVPEVEFYRPTRRFVAVNACLNFGIRLEPVLGARGKIIPRGGPPISPEEFDAVLRRLVRAQARPTAVTPQNVGLLRIASEQALNSESRIVLGHERDAFGLRRTSLDWRLGELDFHTMRVGATAFGAHLAEQDVGRARVRDWLLADPPDVPGVLEAEVGGSHHMCATRMADDARHGVVDRHCRVHGIGNLYIGGSSVFATPGHANPTYTLVQLALRLADHLAHRRPG